MTYNFDFKMQLIYGILAFILVLAIVYIVNRQLNWAASIIVGIINFAVSGFYKKHKRDDVKENTNQKQ